MGNKTAQFLFYKRRSAAHTIMMKKMYRTVSKLRRPAWLASHKESSCQAEHQYHINIVLHTVRPMVSPLVRQWIRGLWPMSTNFCPNWIRPSKFGPFLSPHLAHIFVGNFQNFVWTGLWPVQVFIKFFSTQGSVIWHDFHRSCCYYSGMGTLSDPGVQARSTTCHIHIYTYFHWDICPFLAPVLLASWNCCLHHGCSLAVPKWNFCPFCIWPTAGFPGYLSDPRGGWLSIHWNQPLPWGHGISHVHSPKGCHALCS